MKRICIFGASSNIGGTEKYILELIKAFGDNIGCDLLIGHSVGAFPFEEEVILNGGRILREYYTYKERFNEGYISPSQIIKKHKEWVGVYVNLQQLNTAYSLLVEARKNNIMYRIIHAHSTAPTRKLSLKDSLYKIYYRLTYKKVLTHKFACSEKAGRWFYGKKETFQVIPNSINFNDYKFDNSNRKIIRKILNISENDLVVGFLGRLTYEKNPLFAIDIINGLDDCYKLLMVGDGYLKEAVDEKISSLSLEKKVIRVGEVKNVSEFYNAMDCLIVPSCSEGFGIVLLEGQASGLICFASKGVISEEVNITGRVIYVDEFDNPQDWCEAIKYSDKNRKNVIHLMENSPYSNEALRELMTKLFHIADGGMNDEGF